MWYIFLKALVTVLVIYAIIHIVSGFVSALMYPKPYKDEDSFVVIKVRNQEKNLEYAVRSVVWQSLSLSRGGYIPNILIVDSGSVDGTREIAEKLCEQYAFVFYTTEDDFEKMKDAFSK